MESVDMKTAIATRVGFILSFSLLVFAFGACQRGPVVESNLNTNLSTNANLTPANTNTNAQPIATLAAREPDKYKATLVFTAQTEGGDNAIGIPPLSAEVARNGDLLTGLSHAARLRQRFAWMWWLPREQTTLALHDAPRDRIVIVQASEDAVARSIASSVGV